jgi:hypothetical protein
MPKRNPLVCQHLENLSRELLELSNSSPFNVLRLGTAALRGFGNPCSPFGDPLCPALAGRRDIFAALIPGASPQALT